MTRNLAAGIGLCAVLATSNVSAAAPPPVSMTLTASPDPVLPGDPVTLVLTVTNNGPDMTRPIIGIIGWNFFNVSAPAGWTTQLYDLCEAYECNPATTGFTTPVMRAGETARFSAVSSVRRPPGATIVWRAFVSSSAFPAVAETSATTTVRGSGQIPGAPTALFALDSTRTAASNFLATASLSFDAISGRFLEAALELFSVSTGQLAAGLINSSGQPATGMLPLESITADYPTSIRSAYSADVRLGGEIGGYGLAWTSLSGALNAVVVSSSGQLQSSRGVIASGTPRLGSIAYSPVSHLFLVAWAECGSNAPLDCSSLVQPVGLDGQPVGSATTIGPGSRPKIVWNPVSSEFAIVRVLGDSGGETIELARTSAAGQLLGGARVEQYATAAIAEIDVNAHSGHYVVVWNDVGVLGAELSGSGRVISQGLIGTDIRLSGSDTRPLAYNPVSDTFLVAAHVSGASSRMVELNQFGAPLSQRTELFAPFDREVVEARSDAAEWRVLGTEETCCTFFQSTRGVGTLTRSGGSTMRLGGCMSPDPFVAMGGGTCFDFGWLPPGIDAPGTTPLSTIGGCTTPDPFAALGGGTCVNGAWLPPGTSTTPPPPPSTGSCSGAAPGTGWVCLNGGWLPATHPLAISGGTTTSTPSATSCTTPDPFTAMGGGVCINGGWIPKTNPLAGGG